MSLTCLSTCLDQMKELVIVKGLPYSEIKISRKEKNSHTKGISKKSVTRFDSFNNTRK